MLILSSSAVTSATPASRQISVFTPPVGRSVAGLVSLRRTLRFPADGRILSVASCLRRSLLGPIICAAKVVAMAEIVEDKESVERVPVKSLLKESGDEASTNGSGSETPESTGHSRTFLEAKTEKDRLD